MGNRNKRAARSAQLTTLVVAALCCAAPAAKAAPPAAAPAAARAIDAGAVAIKADQRVVLGVTSRVTLTISAKDQKGDPLDVAPPRLSVSTGDLGTVNRAAPGVWKTVYTPPPTAAAPQVAVVLAAIDGPAGDAVGFAALPLYGRGATTVKTKPGTDVTVFAGGEKFGPIKADAGGRAIVPLVLGPGVKSATTRVLDEAGNDAEKKIDLGIPPFNRVAALALDDVTTADGTGSARVLAVCVDETGAPAVKAQLRVGSTGGVVEEGADIAPGMRVLTLKPGALKDVHSVDVVVSLPGSKESMSKATVALVPAAPARAIITLSREKLGDEDVEREVLVTAKLVDAGGNAVPPQAAGVFVDLGRIASFHTDDDGTRRLTWIVPAGSERRRATLTVHLPSGAVVGRADVALGMTARAISFDPVDFVVADGDNSVDLVIRVRNPDVNNVAVQLVDPDDGVVGRPRVEGGVIKVKLTPARVDAEKKIFVRAVAGESHAEVSVALAPGPHAGPLLGGTLVVESNYGKLVGVGPEVSLVTQLYGPIYAGGSVALLQAVVKPVEDHRALPLFASLQWRPAMAPDMDFIVGVDGGPVLSDLVDGGKHRLEFALGGQAQVGVGFRAGPGTVDVMGRAGSAVYLFGALAQSSVGLPFGAGVSVGYRFEL